VEHTSQPPTLRHILNILSDTNLHALACAVPLKEANGKHRKALVFVVKDHLDHAVIFDLFTSTICEWIDAGLMDIPEGYLDWQKKHQGGPQ